MAYSTFESPKLHNAKSLKFFPEEYDHPVSFRHKVLSPDFDLSIQDYNRTVKNSEDTENHSIRAQGSSQKKCPIYVHQFGDFLPKKPKKSKSKHKAVIAKLEESYWANWKPNKNDLKKPKSPMKNVKPPEIQVIKSAPVRRRKIKIYPHLEEDSSTIELQIESQEKIKKVISVSQEIQTDDVPAPPEPEETPPEVTIESVQVEEPPKADPPNDEEDSKFLKHTDSLILHVKKQKKEKEHFDQPKCIRLYQKPGKMTSKNFVKGGSYPLKSCLKKENILSKGSRGNRPRSPMIVSSNFGTKSKYNRSHRH